MREMIRDGYAKRVLAIVLLVPAAALSMGFSCDGPHHSGAVGFVQDGERLGVVLADPGDFGGADDGSTDEPRELFGDLLVAWTTDGNSFTTPEAIATPERSAIDREVCGANGCVEVTGYEVPDGAAGSTRVVPASRERLARRSATSCAHPETAVSAVSALPGSGQVVLAMGQAGIAVQDADGSWDRVAVAGNEPMPVTLRDGPDVLRHLLPDGLPPLVLAGVAWWVLTASGRLRNRQQRGDRLPWSLVVIPAVVFFSAGQVALFMLFGGTTSRVLGFLGLIVLLMTVPAAALAARRVPTEVRRANLAAIAQGAAAGVLVVVLWLAGMPGPYLLWLAVSLAVTLGVLVRRALAQDRGGTPAKNVEPTIDGV